MSAFIGLKTLFNEDFKTALQIFVQTFVIFTRKVNIANSARKD